MKRVKENRKNSSAGFVFAACIFMTAAFCTAVWAQDTESAEDSTELRVEDNTELSAEDNDLQAVRIDESGLEDGLYFFEAELQGGTGRASFEGPLLLILEEQEAYLVFTMSSSYYDYVLLDGEKYLPMDKGGNSTFSLPVNWINDDFHFAADTTAMSEPHEIDYSVRIDLGSLCKWEK